MRLQFGELIYHLVVNTTAQCTFVPS